ncbi:hypothetical protein NC653_019084 [Populus alba x Populus x berolinensis]|uniref:Uncharacterized protein n=1 Tax=Populus alba x Populus x berolinensis TaxID=444605 RepID=A0AAD6QHZ1_9ROSI|nr:hypothetical protein NC653_019084 [Populus alba x Populus x berolinensis]
MRPPDGGFQGCVRIVTTVPPSLGELRPILSKLENDKDKEIFGLVSKRWLRLQSTERKELAARAGPHMLQKMAARFSRLIELDFFSVYFKALTSTGNIKVPIWCQSHSYGVIMPFAAFSVCCISDKGMMSIGGLSSLQSLNVSYCKKLMDKGLSDVAEGCQDLQIVIDPAS